MPNSLHRSAIASPASRRATNCILSSIAEHSFQGIIPSLPEGGSVTYVFGTMCYLCSRPLILVSDRSFSIPQSLVASFGSGDNLFDFVCGQSRPDLLLLLNN